MIFFTSDIFALRGRVWFRLPANLTSLRPNSITTSVSAYDPGRGPYLTAASGASTVPILPEDVTRTVNRARTAFACGFT